MATFLAGLILLGVWMIGLFVVRSILDHDL